MSSHLISVRNICIHLFVSCRKPKGNFTFELIPGLIAIKPQVAFASRLPNWLFMKEIISMKWVNKFKTKLPSISHVEITELS